MRQNITYSCDSGVDGFTMMQLQGINGGLIHYGDKTISMVSQVCTVMGIYTCTYLPTLPDFSGGGWYIHV